MPGAIKDLTRRRITPPELRLQLGRAFGRDSRVRPLTQRVPYRESFQQGR